MGHLDLKIIKSADQLDVTMAGVIDEDVDFNQHPLSGAKKVHIKMGSLKSINSCGIREWIKWMESASSAEIIYEDCPKVIVDQINMVDGFLPANAKVVSFYVPYYNDDTGSEKNILFKYGQEYKNGTLTPPESIKDESGNDMEMDVVESKYFKFIKKIT